MKCNIFKQVSQLFSLRHALQEAGFTNISFTSIKREYQPDNLFFKCNISIENNIGIELDVCDLCAYLGISIAVFNESYKLTQKAIEVSSVDEIIQIIKTLIDQFNVDCNVLVPL